MKSYNASNGIQFNVRVVNEGDNYGLDNCLTHEGEKPLVEFYDARFPHTKYGQFVSRYYVETILPHEGELNLDFGIPDWSIDSVTLAKIVSDLGNGLV